ncbi:MAG: nuclear transport factor 2 family protein [Bacteroidota bacterium]
MKNSDKPLKPSFFLILGILILITNAIYANMKDTKAEIESKTSQWLQMWSPENNLMTFEGIEDIFATKEDGLLVVDGFEGGVVVLKSISEYKEKWGPLMNNTFSYYKIKPQGDIQIEVSKDLATATFVWVTEKAVLKDGTEIALSQHATHIWKKINGEWKIIHEHLTNNNVAEEPEQNPEEEIKGFLEKWQEAWSPGENASSFTMESVRPFYIQDESLLAFDFTDSEQKTVIKGYQAHRKMWAPFVPSFKFWTFTPVRESVTIYELGEEGAGVALYVDNFGIRPDGSEFRARAHATLILKKIDGEWKIVHENIWGPVKEGK